MPKNTNSSGHAKKDSGEWSVKCNKEETPKLSSPSKKKPVPAGTQGHKSHEESLPGVGSWTK